MALSLSSLTLNSFRQTLGALSGILDKTAAHCEAKKVDPAVLLGSRLYPDMFALTRQVQLACDFAKNCIGRLTGEPPKFPDEEKTIPELKARIANTLAYIGSVKPADIDASETKDVTFPTGPQQTMTLKGDAYVLQVVLPNFYFHAATAYDILRHNGIEIGKRDFLGRP
jgi:hypothetical protein